MSTLGLMRPDLRRGMAPPEGLTALKRGANDDPEKLAKACREFESLFMHQLIKAMRKTVPKDGYLGDSYARNTFTDMLDGELAKQMGRSGGVGLHQLLVEQLGGHVGAGGPAPVLSHPLDGPLRVTSGFGQRRHPVDGAQKAHHGVDLAATRGAPVRSAAGGIVERAESRGGYGLVVDVRHRGETVTRYAHLSELLVEEGERLARGQVLGRVGETGRTTGPHLHFEVRTGGKPADPMAFLEEERESSQVARYTTDVLDKK